MGTDIHGIFQRRDPATKAFVDVPTRYDEGRHYQLFAVLAGVRNGTGFAGVQTGQPVRPIAEPRGLPTDFVMHGESHPLAAFELLAPWRAQNQRANDPLEVWMGDHSQSWLSGAEMLAWAKQPRVVVQTGVLDKAEYARWDKVSPPDSYSGDVWGANVLIAPDNAPAMQAQPGYTHVRVNWDSPLTGGDNSELKYFFDEVQRLVDEHGEIRFVFGFDS